MGKKGDNGQPKRLTTWRITSPHNDLVKQAAGLYGGKPKPWESPTGKQFEVVTATAELPVLVMPGYSFRQSYEHRTSPTLVERRCDGIEQDDGTPCACNADGFEGDECTLITRLTVALPELTTMLGWRLETKGDNAARELLGSMALVQGVAGGRQFIPAKLRIVERRGNVGGQAVRYVMPVIDVVLPYAAILGGELAPREQASLPAGYIPIESRRENGTTLADGLTTAETQTLKKPPRVALPDDDVEDEEPGAPPPPPAPGGAAQGEAPRAESEEKPLTLHRTKQKMNALVGQLRDGGHITTANLWAAVAKERDVEVETMIALLNGRDDAGELHWSLLRDDLQLAEARNLHARLARLWMNVEAAPEVSA